ncbi:hypothetical protein [Streptomyces sp. cmx-4-9]|uniref:hypothetical protein n=1 Tax=Streptomyces sp. cmx-4-9 TaxID=2790941 RepID=UPI00397FCF1B
MLTDRDERLLLAAAEKRVCAPLRVGAALTRLRRALAHRGRSSARRREERESVACPPEPALR